MVKGVWHVDNKQVVVGSANYIRLIKQAVKQAIGQYDSQLKMLVHSENKSSQYFLIYRAENPFFQVIRISNHRPYSHYYSMRSYNPQMFTGIQEFVQELEHFLEVSSWNRFKPEHYLLLSFLWRKSSETSYLYVEGDREAFTLGRGKLHFTYVEHGIVKHLPTDHLASQLVRQMIAVGLLNHYVTPKHKVRIVVSTTGKDSLKVHHAWRSMDVQWQSWQELLANFKESDKEQAVTWYPKHVHMSAQHLNRQYEKRQPAARNITSFELGYFYPKERVYSPAQISREYIKVNFDSQTIVQSFHNEVGGYFQPLSQIPQVVQNNHMLQSIHNYVNQLELSSDDAELYQLHISGSVFLKLREGTKKLHILRITSMTEFADLFHMLSRLTEYEILPFFENGEYV